MEKVTILTDINTRGIYRTERSLSSLKTEILLVNQLKENDKKEYKQDRKTEICFYFPCFYSPLIHKVQSTEEFIEDRKMNIVFHNQYAWTNNIWTDRWQFETIAPTQNIYGKIIISFNNNDRHIERLIETLNDRCTPFIVFFIHITDIFISFILILQLTTKLMNRFSYSITTHFIPSNKDYHSYCNPHSVYQTYPKCF